MSIYHLKCTYRFDDGRAGLAFDARDIEALDHGTAIVLADTGGLTSPNMQLASAYLFAPDGAVVWSILPGIVGRADDSGKLVPFEG